jgi:hypothetical protein
MNILELPNELLYTIIEHLEIQTLQQINLSTLQIYNLLKCTNRIEMVHQDMITVEKDNIIFPKIHISNKLNNNVIRIFPVCEDVGIRIMIDENYLQLLPIKSRYFQQHKMILEYIILGDYFTNIAYCSFPKQDKTLELIRRFIFEVREYFIEYYSIKDKLTINGVNVYEIIMNQIEYKDH